MAIIDGNFDFGAGAKQAISGNSDVISANVIDVGSAKNLAVGPFGLQVGVFMDITGGTSPTMRARLVGADNAALSSNPEILADSGVKTLQEDGSTALASGSKVYLTLKPAGQRVPKRYYGMVYTMGGTTPTADVYLQPLVFDAQTNMVGPKAAVP